MKKEETVWEKLKKCPKKTGNFINNSYIQVIMFVVTIYALIGDDVKLLTLS